MYGRGTSDNKGQHLAQLWTIRSARLGQWLVSVSSLTYELTRELRHRFCNSFIWRFGRSKDCWDEWEKKLLTAQALVIRGGTQRDVAVLKQRISDGQAECHFDIFFNIPVRKLQVEEFISCFGLPEANPAIRK